MVYPLGMILLFLQTARVPHCTGHPEKILRDCRRLNRLIALIPSDVVLVRNMSPNAMTVISGMMHLSVARYIFKSGVDGCIREIPSLESCSFIPFLRSGRSSMSHYIGFC